MRPPAPMRRSSAEELGIFTKADQIEAEETEDPTLGIILESETMRDYRLKHKWWPFRGRKKAERDVDMSRTVLQGRQDELFKQPAWQSIQSKAGRRFEVRYLLQVILDIFSKMVISK